jgi:predicted DCC family thiol-disulfide oxidoreductase YuxK
MTIEELPKNNKIVLFDGVCNLCDASIHFIIKHDKKDIFRFVSIQSDLGKLIINHIGLNVAEIDGVILFVPDTIFYTKAQAVFSILKDFEGFYSVFYYFIYLPKLITNTLYDFVAINRYKWYGIKESCMISTIELEAKFLS